MAHPIARTLITALALALALTLLSQSLALAQNQTTTVYLPAGGTFHTWNDASAHTPYGRKIFVVTVAQPTHRETCRIQSFTVDRLVCQGPFGRTRIHKPQDVAALILPGEFDLKLRLLLGFDGASAAAAWGTLVLAATCIPCAVATGVVALFFFGASGAILIGDDQPDALLYLAPGQQLQVKVRY
jgi:hypothetical protein